MTTNWAERLQFAEEEIGPEFIRVASHYQSALKIRLSPEVALKQLERELVT